MKKIYHNSGMYITYSIQSGKSPYVIFLHGLMSDMNGTKAIAIGKHLSENGIGYIRFDCRGHGQSEGNFSEFGIGDWADDASLIINELTKEPVILVGSSMGGWSMLLNAIRYPKKVHGLIGIAPAPDFTENILNNFNDKEILQLSTKGYVDIPSEYGDSPYIISKKLINSGKENLLLNSKIKINCPVHLLHGGQDADVPIETSLKIMEQIESGDVKLTIVKSANHQFSEQKNLKLIFNSINEMIN